jgi:hypothetical protein
MHRTFSMNEYFFVIISRAFRTLEPLSLTIAENLLTPTRIKISSIFSAMNSPV